MTFTFFLTFFGAAHLVTLVFRLVDKIERP